jgi:hypothetical protein
VWVGGRRGAGSGSDWRQHLRTTGPGPRTTLDLTCWRSWLSEIQEASPYLFGRPTRDNRRGVLTGFLGGVSVSCRSDEVCILLSPAMDEIAVMVSRDWAGVVGDVLCSRTWPRCFFCSLVPHMVGSEAGPSGDERISSPLLSFFLLGFGSMWWRGSVSSWICVIVAQPSIPSRWVVP